MTGLPSAFSPSQYDGIDGDELNADEAEHKEKEGNSF